MPTSRLQFADLIRDGSLTIGDGYRAKNEELGGAGPVFLRAAYLQDAGFVLDNPERFKITSLARFGPKVSRWGDVVITTKGNSTGRVGRIRADQIGAIYSPHLSYWRSLDPRRLDHGFLYYWSRSTDFLSQLRGMAHGTDMAPYMSLRDQLSLWITLPDAHIQRAIGETLGALDDKIELNRRMNETLEAMARAIFKDWFVDFGPTRAKQEGRAPYLAQDIWSLFPDRLDDEGKPEGWKIAPLGTCFDVNPSESIRLGSAAPYLDMAALPTTGPNADEPVDREFRSGSKFRNGDTLVARITPCLENGKTAYVQHLPAGSVGWGSTEFIVLRSRPPIPAFVPYLVSRLEDFRANAIRSMSGTSGRQRVNASDIQRYLLPRPDEYELWHAFARIGTPMFERIAKAQAESRTLAALRDLLLPKLMSGEIRIREAEKAVEGAL